MGKHIGEKQDFEAPSSQPNFKFNKKRNCMKLHVLKFCKKPGKTMVEHVMRYNILFIRKGSRKKSSFFSGPATKALPYLVAIGTFSFLFGLKI